MKSVFRNTLTFTFILTVLIHYKVAAQQVEPDAIYLDQLKEYTLNPDGSWSFHYSHKLKLLTYYSIHTLYGEDFILYNPDFQKLKINRSVTVMADGTLATTPENAFNPLLPGFAVNAPAFNQLREMAVTHTGLERGCIEDFDYTVNSDKGYSGFFSGNEALWMNSPVEKLTFIITIPTSTTFNYNQFNINEKPQIIKSGNQLTYRWVLNNLPAATREDFRPKELQNRPRIVFSSAVNAGKLFESFLKQPAFDYKPGEKIEKLGKDVRKELKSDLPVMMRLQDIVTNEVNYHAVPLNLTCYKVRNSEETLKANGGTEIEKAVLLATLLNAAGLKSVPVAIIPERYFDKKTFNLQLIEKVLVKCINSKGEVFYLSPLQSDLQDQQFQLYGKTIIPLIQGNSFQIERCKPESAELELKADYDLSKNMKLTGSMNLILSNRLNPYFKLSQDSTYARKLLVGCLEPSMINSFTIGSLEPDHSTIEYQVSVTDFAKEIAGHYFLEIPGLYTGIDGWHMTELVSNRQEPLEIPFPVNESYQYSITLPEGYVLITAETDLSIKKDFGSLNIHISQEGKTLNIEKKIRIEKTSIETSQYPEFKSFINTWTNKKYRELVFRIGPK